MLPMLTITLSRLLGSSWFLSPWFPLTRIFARFLESRFTLQITKTVMRRIEKMTAPMIKLSCHFSSLFSFPKSLFSKSSFLTGSLPSVVTIKEKMLKCLMSALCDAGVAVTLTCVTVPEEASSWEVRSSRQGVVCFVSRETEDGWTLPVIEDWLESAWGKSQNRKLNGCFQTLLNISWENWPEDGNVLLTYMRCEKPSVNNGRLNHSSLNKGILLICALDLNKLYTVELSTAIAKWLSA